MHEGHRKRMLERVRSNDKMHEHEILEILLYNAYPRKNTNPVAHALIERFRNVEGVFKADIEELLQVVGVGYEVAAYLKVLSRCMELSKDNKNDEFVRCRKDLEDFVIARFVGKTKELLEFYGLDQHGRIQRVYSYTSENASKVELALSEISKSVFKLQHFGLVMAHNHIASSSEPSEQDNRITGVCLNICRLAGTHFYDHFIYSSSGMYSYYKVGKLDTYELF